MAELINQQDPYDPTGYQLRRFGLWAHIQAAPQTRQGNRTELMAVPRDIASDYEEAIAGTVIDAALLQRVEKVCRLRLSGFAAAFLPHLPRRGWRWAKWLRPSVRRPLVSCCACQRCSSCASATVGCLSTTNAWPGSKGQTGNPGKPELPKRSPTFAKNWSASWKAAA